MVTESMEGNAAPRPCILADAHRSGSDATLCSGSKFVGFCRFWAQNLWNFDRCFHSNSRVHFEASLSFLAMRDRAGLSRSPEERRSPLAIPSQSNSILLPGDAGRSAIQRRIPRWAKRGGGAAVNLKLAPPRAHSSTAHWTLPHHLLQTHLAPAQLVVCPPCPLPYARKCRAAIASSVPGPPELSRRRKLECNPQGKRAPTRARFEAGAGGELTQERTCALSCIYSHRQIRIQQRACGFALSADRSSHLLPLTKSHEHGIKLVRLFRHSRPHFCNGKAPVWIESALWERESCTQTLTLRAEVSRVAQPDGSASRLLLRLGSAPVRRLDSIYSSFLSESFLSLSKPPLLASSFFFFSSSSFFFLSSSSCSLRSSSFLLGLPTTT